MKIKNLKELGDEIRRKHSEFRSRVEGVGGYALYFRALTAQLLWFLLGYIIISKFLPITELIYSVSILIAVGLSYHLWPVIKPKLPDWVVYITKGEFFYDLDRQLLNSFLFVLAILCMFLLLLPPLNLKRSKE